jgi:diguanylate cyclase (GGDEF)-like protein/PAS domain S-box-containing protein
MKINDIDPLNILETLQEGVLVHDATAAVRYANPKALELLRLTEEQALGRAAKAPGWRLIDSRHRAMPERELPVNRVLAERRAVSNVEIGICDDSTEHITWVICNAFPQFGPAGGVSSVVVGLSDISSKKTDIPFEAIVANANDIILITRADVREGHGPQIVYVNQAFCDLTGYLPEEVIGNTPGILQGEGTSVETRNRIRAALRAKQPVRATILNYSKAGNPYWLDMNIFPLRNALGEVSYFAAVERDITDQVEKEARLRDLATRDPLTGLLNRRGFFDLAKRQLAAQEQGNVSTVAIIDIDFFKRINDSFGHDCGDRALVHVTSLLRLMFRESDLICRFGGEEFVVLLPGAGTDVGRVKLEAFRTRIADTPFDTGKGQSIVLTVSIGVSQVDADPMAIEPALNGADKVLYQAKQGGRNRTVVSAEKS